MSPTVATVDGTAHATFVSGSPPHGGVDDRRGRDQNASVIRKSGTAGDR